MSETEDYSGETFRIVGDISEAVYINGFIGGDPWEVAHAVNALFDLAKRQFTRVTRDEQLIVEFFNSDHTSDDDEWLR